MKNKVTIRLTPQSLDNFMSMMIKGMKVEFFHRFSLTEDPDTNPESVVLTDNTLFFTLKVKAVRRDSEKGGIFITPAFNE